MPPTIRPYAEADRTAVAEQFLGLNRFEDGLIPNRRIDPDGGEASLHAALGLVHTTGGIALVAERNGAIIGHLFMTIERHGAYVREDLRTHAHISELFVRPEARGQGIATALIREAERRAATRGLGEITLGVVVGNDNAARLYAALGYRAYATAMTKPVPPIAQGTP